MLNLKVRLKQKWFWITLIPLVFLLFDQIIGLCNTIQAIVLGDTLYGSDLMVLTLEIVGTVFAVLALIGFPVDLTTDGYGDSARALNYEEPAPNASETAMIIVEDEQIELTD